MNESLLIMVAGLGAVFVGMSFLYLAMRLTALVADWIVKRKEHVG